MLTTPERAQRSPASRLAHPFVSGSGAGWALALVTTFATSLITPLVRGAVVGGMDPSSMLLMRLLIAVGLLAGTLAITAPPSLKIDRRGLWLVVGIGVISGVEICCFFWSLAYVDAAMNAMIKSTQPLVVLLLLAIGGERYTGRNVVRVALSIAGVYLLIGVGGHVAPFGLVLLGASLLLYAVQLVFIQWWLRDYDSRTVALYLMGVMTLVIAAWWGVQGAEWEDPGVNGWLVIIVLAVVSTFLARLALYSAIPRIGSGQVALLWPLNTLSAILLSVLFLHERFTLVQWAGGVLILFSALLAVQRLGRSPR